MTPRPLRIVEGDLPVGYRKVLWGRLAGRAAGQLNEIAVFDPVIFRLGSYQKGGPIAQYLLLPEAQAEFWLFVLAGRHDNDPDSTIAAPRSVFFDCEVAAWSGARTCGEAEPLVRPRWRLRSQAARRGGRGAS